MWFPDFELSGNSDCPCSDKAGPTCIAVRFQTGFSCFATYFRDLILGPYPWTCQGLVALVYVPAVEINDAPASDQQWSRKCGLGCVAFRNVHQSHTGLFVFLLDPFARLPCCNPLARLSRKVHSLSVHWENPLHFLKTCHED